MKARAVFPNHLRDCVRQMISEVIAAEAPELRGAEHSPDDDGYRAGSIPGHFSMKVVESRWPLSRVRQCNENRAALELPETQVALSATTWRVDCDGFDVLSK